MQPAMPGRWPVPAGDCRRPDRDNLLLAAHAASSARDSGAAPAFSGRLGPTSPVPAKTWHSGCGRAIVIHVKKNTASTRRLVSNGEGNADEPADKTFGVARVGRISGGRRARPSPH